MKVYGQFCPVAQALELVGDRWTLLIIRELLSGSKRFGEILNGVRRIPRSVLASRLEDLEGAGLVDRTNGAHGHEYTPTDATRALEPIVLSALARALPSWFRLNVFIELESGSDGKASGAAGPSRSRKSPTRRRLSHSSGAGRLT